jgi:hypothetical protein
MKIFPLCFMYGILGSIGVVKLRSWWCETGGFDKYFSEECLFHNWWLIPKVAGIDRRYGRRYNPFIDRKHEIRRYCRECGKQQEYNAYRCQWIPVWHFRLDGSGEILSTINWLTKLSVPLQDKYARLTLENLVKEYRRENV